MRSLSEMGCRRGPKALRRQWAGAWHWVGPEQDTRSARAIGSVQATGASQGLGRCGPRGVGEGPMGSVQAMSWSRRRPLAQRRSSVLVAGHGVDAGHGVGATGSAPSGDPDGCGPGRLGCSGVCIGPGVLGEHSAAAHPRCSSTS